jgi:hypothetical protein
MIRSDTAQNFRRLFSSDLMAFRNGAFASEIAARPFMLSIANGLTLTLLCSARCSIKLS